MQANKKQIDLTSACLSSVPQRVYKDVFDTTWQENCQEETFSRASERLNTLISRKAIKMEVEIQKRKSESISRVSPDSVR